MTAFVSVEALEVGYGGVTAVAGVSFALAAGEHVTLLGPSGCGKTTTLRAIAGLERARAGRIAIDGQALSDPAAGIDLPPERRGLSMVFQSYAIWPHMSVFDNVAFPFKVRGAARETTRKSVESALALVDLAGFADRPATKLSGGQQQRVAVARAIAYESRVILFDEPLSNLDAQLRIQMRTELADLRRRLGLTAIYVTHDQEEALALSDRVIVMRSGVIEQEGPPVELYRNPRTRFVASFLGMRNILDAEIGPGDRDGLASAKLADGTVLAASDLAGGVPTAAAAIGFRPGRVQLGDATAQGAPGTVTGSMFLGETVQTIIRSGPVEICAQTHRAQPFAVGEAVRWRVDPEDCLVLRQ
jgi:ABC-type Fe3+/spermidine/putrescine transport system ATPase subunit